MAKTLCKLKKLLKDNPKAIAEFTSDPRVACERCGRVANKKKQVCEPKKL
jgi:hypothetical protein